VRKQLRRPADEAPVEEHLRQRLVAGPFLQHVETVPRRGVAHGHRHDTMLDLELVEPRHQVANVRDPRYEQHDRGAAGVPAQCVEVICARHEFRLSHSSLRILR
jgi:hypothetical protein